MWSNPNELGYKKLDAGTRPIFQLPIWLCPKCGAVAGDIALHEEWHIVIRRMVEIVVGRR